MQFTARWIRRALAAIGVSTVIALVVRIRSSQQVPLQRGQWRALGAAELGSAQGPKST